MPRWKSKLEFKSEHGVIQSIFLKLHCELPEIDAKLLVTRAVYISNDLYGNELASSFKMAKEIMQLVGHKKPVCILNEIMTGQEQLQAKWKLVSIMKTEITGVNKF